LTLSLILYGRRTDDSAVFGRYALPTPFSSRKRAHEACPFRKSPISAASRFYEITFSLAALPRVPRWLPSMLFRCRADPNAHSIEVVSCEVFALQQRNVSVAGGEPRAISAPGEFRGNYPPRLQPSDTSSANSRGDQPAMANLFLARENLSQAVSYLLRRDGA